MFEGQGKIPDEYLRAIGQVVLTWNSLEALVHLALVKLLGSDSLEGRSHAVFAPMSFPQKLDVLTTLMDQMEIPANHPFGRYKTEVHPLLTEAQAQRDLLLHSLWGVKDGEVCVSSIASRGLVRVEERPVPLGEVEAASELIKKAGLTLFLSVVVSADPQTGE